MSEAEYWKARAEKTEARSCIAVRMLSDLCDAREQAMLDGETEESAEDAALWLKVGKHLNIWNEIDARAALKEKDNG